MPNRNNTDEMERQNSIKEKTPIIDNYSLKTLDNALNVLECFDQEHPELGLSEVCKMVGLHKSVVFRLLYTLQERGYLEQSTHTKKFRLGMKCFVIGSRMVDHMGLGLRIQPVIEKLALDAGETVNVGVIRGREVIYLNKVVPQSPLRIEAHIGARFPAHCTALGKAVLAFMPPEEISNYINNWEIEKSTSTCIKVDDLLSELSEIRSRGYSWSDQELFEGIACLGVPIFDKRGRIYAGLSMAMVRYHALDENRKQKLIRMLINASHEISGMITLLTF